VGLVTKLAKGAAIKVIVVVHRGNRFFHSGDGATSTLSVPKTVSVSNWQPP